MCHHSTDAYIWPGWNGNMDRIDKELLSCMAETTNKHHRFTVFRKIHRKLGNVGDMETMTTTSIIQ